MNVTAAGSAPEVQRPWWMRVLLFPASRILIAALAVIAPAVLLGRVVALAHLPAAARHGISTLGGALAGAAGYVLYVRLVERRAVGELAPARAGRELGLGAALGALLFSATVLALAALGVFRVIGSGPATAALAPLASAIMAGVLEEILFRGVVFRIAEEWLGSWLALAASAGIFGLLHLNSPNPTLLGVVSIAFEAGVLLGAAFLLTRRLWFPIGLHVAWNFTQGGVFGVAVSGTPSRGLLQGTLSGPEWLSGGRFGAEASVVAVALCLAVAGVLLRSATRRGRLVAPSWRVRPRARS